MMIGGCATHDQDILSLLPMSVAGQHLNYASTDGRALLANDPNAWQLKVAKRFGIGPEAVLMYRCYLDPTLRYNSDVIEFKGIPADQLLPAVMSASGFGGATRIDMIEGKRVLRGMPDAGDQLDIAPYFYGFRDAVMIIVGTDATAAEGLRNLP